MAGVRTRTTTLDDDGSFSSCRVETTLDPPTWTSHRKVCSPCSRYLAALAGVRARTTTLVDDGSFSGCRVRRLYVHSTLNPPTWRSSHRKVWSPCSRYLRWQLSEHPPILVCSHQPPATSCPSPSVSSACSSPPHQPRTSTGPDRTNPIHPASSFATLLKSNPTSLATAPSPGPSHLGPSLSPPPYPGE